MKTRYILLTISLIITFKSFCQETNDFSRVFNSTEITFYGYDFSHFKLNEPKRLYDTNIKNLIPAWIGFLNEHTNEIDLQKRFKKTKVLFDFDYTLTKIDSLDETKLVSVMKHTISVDSLQSYVSNYNIRKKEGIGFVVIIESFEKSTDKCYAYFVFFDIATKKILMSDYFSAREADGYGMINYWGTGLNATFGKYISDVYRKKLRQSN